MAPGRQQLSPGQSRRKMLDKLALHCGGHDAACGEGNAEVLVKAKRLADSEPVYQKYPKTLQYIIINK